MESKEAADALTRLCEEYDLYSLQPTVCLTHMRFIPCRKNQGCVFSEAPEDIQAVQEYQSSGK